MVMGKKAFIVVIITSLIWLVALGGFTIKETIANFGGPQQPTVLEISEITFEKPAYSAGQNVTFAFNVTHDVHSSGWWTVWPAITGFAYKLDDFPLTEFQPELALTFLHNETDHFGQLVLVNTTQWHAKLSSPYLGDGQHRMYVVVTIKNGAVDSATWEIKNAQISAGPAFFEVDSLPPSILVLSPQNVTHTSQNVALDFAINKTASWMANSLDGQGNITISGNITLTNLANGPHNLVICANDTTGNVGKSSTVFFTIAISKPSPSQSPTPSPSPTPAPTHQPTIEHSQTPDRLQIGDFAPVIIPGSMILLAIIAVALLVFFVRRKGMK